MEIFRKAASVKTYGFVKEADVASLKTVINNLNIDKLKTVLDNLDNLKSQVNVINTGKLKTVPVDEVKQGDQLNKY